MKLTPAASLAAGDAAKSADNEVLINAPIQRGLNVGHVSLASRVNIRSAMNGAVRFLCSVDTQFETSPRLIHPKLDIRSSIIFHHFCQGWTLNRKSFQVGVRKPWEHPAQHHAVEAGQWGLSRCLPVSWGIILEGYYFRRKKLKLCQLCPGMGICLQILQCALQTVTAIHCF